MSRPPDEDHPPERSISISVDLDSDGFLRRECPHCEREFKWLPSDDSEPMLDGGYYCPYCNQQADADQWFTKAQIEYVRAAAIHDATGPLLDQLEASVERFNPSGSGMISARFERDDAPVPSKPSEPDDMRRVEFSCHAKEPVKVLEAWTEPVHCLICGNTV